MVLVMSAQAGQHVQSGRFMRVYLLAWGLLAAGGLTYLASLALPLDIGLARQPQEVAQPAVDPAQGIELATKALAQIDTVEQTVNEIAKDVDRIKETVDQHDLQEKEAQSRLAALEERVTNLSTPPPAPVAAAVPSAKQKAADKAKAAADKGREAAARMVSVMEQGKAGAAPAAAQPNLETGSIPGSASNITFGEPQVTPAQSYGVQLGAGPSLDALRMSWLALRDQHGNALGSLQPRYVAPRGGTGVYRLVAGPLASKAEADKLCAAMGLTHNDCFATTTLGRPL